LTLSGLRSAFGYDAAARDAVLALKFRGLSAVAPLMAASMAACLIDWAPPIASIVPVPLSGQRRRLRGYNQSELLAKEVSRLSGIPLARRALVRRRSTSPQARLAGDARRLNVVGALGPGKGLPPSGGVLLIDDVVTTGATLDACARVLLSEGIEAVFALTFARED
jgi:ComF family protein